MASPRPAPVRTSRGLVLGLALTAILVPVAMHLLTQQVWEDFFITYRHCENVVRGDGLVYQPGERVHGFTSPLNVLLPALFHALQPDGDYRLPLWGFTLCSLAIFGAGVAGFVRARLDAGGDDRPREAGLLLLLLLLQTKLTAFSTNGQEAGFWAGFLLLAFAAVDRGIGTHWRAGGLALAGLMWTRPDSPVHIAGLAVAALVFPVGSRRETFIGLLKAGALCAVLYLPWFAWTWSYYGSPVPHTILAKMGAYGPSGGVVGWLRQWPAAVARAFEPVYAEAGGWPGWLHGITLVTGAICAVTCVAPLKAIGPATRRASLVFVAAAAYLAVVGNNGFMFPWYFVPCGVAGAVVLAQLLNRLSRPALLLGLLPLVLALGYGTANSLVQLRVQQRIIEGHTRRPLGEWLQAHMSADETVFLEPIGYIGYYSRRHVLDWPGLVSPSVVRARGETGGDIWRTIARLQPDWLVFRPREAAQFAQQAELARAYTPTAKVDNLPQLQVYTALPGYPYLSSDAVFIVYQRRKREAGAVPPMSVTP